MSASSASITDTALAAARASHNAWYLGIVALMGERGAAVSDDSIVNHEDCELGEWLRAQRRVQPSAMLDELVRVHSALHLHVREIADRQHLHLKARSAYALLESSRDRLEQLLDALDGERS